MKMVKCDECRGDLSKARNSIAWRISVKCEYIPLESGVSLTDVWMEAPIAEDGHFCGLKCLKKWVKKQRI